MFVQPSICLALLFLLLLPLFPLFNLFPFKTNTQKTMSNDTAAIGSNNGALVFGKTSTVNEFENVLIDEGTYQAVITAAKHVPDKEKFAVTFQIVGPNHAGVRIHNDFSTKPAAIKNLALLAKVCCNQDPDNGDWQIHPTWLPGQPLSFDLRTEEYPVGSGKKRSKVAFMSMTEWKPEGDFLEAVGAIREAIGLPKALE